MRIKSGTVTSNPVRRVRSLSARRVRSLYKRGDRAAFSSRDFRNEDGIWTWAKLQASWKSEPKLFFAVFSEDIPLNRS
jgi:hypothetical protein